MPEMFLGSLWAAVRRIQESHSWVWTEQTHEESCGRFGEECFSSNTASQVGFKQYCLPLKLFVLQTTRIGPFFFRRRRTMRRLLCGVKSNL